jgi:hypothetical protein
MWSEIEHRERKKRLNDYGGRMNGAAFIRETGKSLAQMDANNSGNTPSFQLSGNRPKQAKTELQRMFHSGFLIQQRWSIATNEWSTLAMERSSRIVLPYVVSRM